MAALQKIFVDANPIYSRVQRDWLLHASLAFKGGMFSLVTSGDVLAEAIARLRDEHPDWNGAATGGLYPIIAENFDSVIYEFDASSPWPGDDDGDRHVHAAAVAADADILVTSDKDFTHLPDEIADQLPYEVFKPDDFFILLDDSSPEYVRQMTQAQLNYWSQRDGTARLGERLRDARCPKFADRVDEHLATLAGPTAHRAFLAKRQAVGRSVR